MLTILKAIWLSQSFNRIIKSLSSKFMRASFFHCVQESADPELEAKDLAPQPCLVAVGTPTNCKAVFLSCEETILCEVPLADTALLILATFSVFNMHFTPGYSNFYFFLEYHFLGSKPPKRTKLQNFITMLYHLK